MTAVKRDIWIVLLESSGRLVWSNALVQQIWAMSLRLRIEITLGRHVVPGTSTKLLPIPWRSVNGSPQLRNTGASSCYSAATAASSSEAL
jgi:hypothetical protein